VICLGVLQHTPDPAESFRKLAEMVKEGGGLVIDVYSKRLSSLISWKYVLRPITKRMPSRVLLRIVKKLFQF
jgi:2-polyprenyl-3-methyl-5-hydroxy-6-metoxy-1,4-benzoquinol methylase